MNLTDEEIAAAIEQNTPKEKTPAEIEAERVASEAKQAEDARVLAEQNQGGKTPEELEAERLASEEAARVAQANQKTPEQIEAERVASEEETKKRNTEFEAFLAEKSKGKVKSFEEFDKIVNAEPVKLDEEIQRLADLKAKGIQLDAAFFELQSKDFRNMTDPLEVLRETMKRNGDYDGLSDETIDFEIERLYNLDEWLEKDEAGEELTPKEKAMKEFLIRDATQNRQWLIDYQAERTIGKPVDENAIKAAEEFKKSSQESWTKYVDNELVAKVTSLNTPVEFDEKGNVKESFVYTISEADRKDFGNTMKLITEDVNVLFNRFALKDDKGKFLTDQNGNVKISHQKVFEMLVKEKAYDDSVKRAYSDGLATGEKRGLNTIKNVNFQQNQSQGNSNTGNPTTEAEALAKAMKEKGISFH